MLFQKRNIVQSIFTSCVTLCVVLSIAHCDVGECAFCRPSRGMNVIMYEWDTHMSVTGTPYGTGYALWKSPDEVFMGGNLYTYTNRVHAYGNGSILGFPIPVDFGIVEAYGQEVLSGTPPHIIYEDGTNGVYPVSVPFFGSIDVYYQINGRAYIDSDRHLYYEFSDFNVYSAFGDINAVMNLDGDVVDGNGTYVVVNIPEPVTGGVMCIVLLFCITDRIKL